MPARQIDHLVITVPDLAHAAAEFEALGFKLTPKAEHPWGTSNRLVQFADQSFLEILTLDRPHLLFEHDPAQSPPIFSFGAYNRDFLARGLSGLSMCAFQGHDSRADVERFRKASLETFQPFDFGRKATLPDGRQVDVGFSLAFARVPKAPDTVLFTCHNRFPENFWKPAFQEHPNGATGLGALWFVSEAPAAFTSCFEGVIDSKATTTHADHITIPAGRHTVELVTQKALSKAIPGAHVAPASSPRLQAFSVRGLKRRDTTAAGGTLLAFL
ncbi:MAG: hypothetical protein RL291_595 [Pseudomonadota bacterium]|jgi:hypothetical protein